ncbi:MAG: hypothetical protein JWN30_2230, partial [Bacilli bacterium]|nr:hypothetical protein [Bacilli bacterium]
EFRSDCQVLLSTESGSEGKNLQFCHQVINVDLPWNPMKLEQRIGRVHRLGQKKNVSIYTVVAQDTIETYILDLLARKIRLFELVVGELDLILGNLDRKRSLEELLIEVWKESQTDEELKQGFAKLGGKATRARKSFSKLKQEESRFWDILNVHS